MRICTGRLLAFLQCSPILGSLELLEMEGAFLAAANVAAWFTVCMGCLMGSLRFTRPYCLPIVDLGL